MHRCRTSSSRAHGTFPRDLAYTGWAKCDQPDDRVAAPNTHGALCPKIASGASDSPKCFMDADVSCGLTPAEHIRQCRANIPFPAPPLAIAIEPSLNARTTLRLSSTLRLLASISCTFYPWSPAKCGSNISRGSRFNARRTEGLANNDDDLTVVTTSTAAGVAERTDLELGTNHN